jgi:hypothetical protein
LGSKTFWPDQLSNVKISWRHYRMVSPMNEAQSTRIDLKGRFAIHRQLGRAFLYRVSPREAIIPDGDSRNKTIAAR